MKERTRNMIVGLTAIAGLIAMAYLVFIFGDLPAWTGDYYDVTFEIDDATGLTEGSRVKLVGVDIGEIHLVRLKDDPAQGVELIGRVDNKYDIPAGSSALSEASLLGGSAALNIVPPPPGTATGQLPHDGTARLHATSTSLGKQLTALTEGIGGDLSKQLENFGRVSESIVRLSEQYIEVGKQLQAMVEPRPLEDVDAGRVPANLSTVLARADARLLELRQTTEQINALFTDEKLIGDLRASGENIRQFTEKANVAADNANQLTVDARQQLQTLTSRYVAVADDMVKSLESLDRLLIAAREGKGTLGRLMNDPALYNAVTDMATQMQDMLKEARLLIQKWKAEGLPVHF